MAASDVLESSANVRDSARGWHQLQVAVLGFIGLCGVLQRGRPENPMWLQTLAALLIVGALAIALAAIFVVGRVAWPPAAPASPLDAARRLRTGIRLTILAVAVLALGTVSMWWPQSGDNGARVSVQAVDGRTWCGRLTATQAGAIGVDTEAGPIVVAFPNVAALQPVDSCG
jgi:hypothetical protein